MRWIASSACSLGAGSAAGGAPAQARSQVAETSARTAAETRLKSTIVRGYTSSCPAAGAPGAGITPSSRLGCRRARSARARSLGCSRGAGGHRFRRKGRHGGLRNAPANDLMPVRGRRRHDRSTRIARAVGPPSLAAIGLSLDSALVDGSRRRLGWRRRGAAADTNKHEGHRKRARCAVTNSARRSADTRGEKLRQRRMPSAPRAAEQAQVTEDGGSFQVPERSAEQSSSETLAVPSQVAARDRRQWPPLIRSRATGAFAAL